MTQYVINIGALPNDGTGDPLRTAFNETNLNFDQIFAAGPVLSNIQIANNTILVTNTNGNLVLATNGIGKIQAAADIVPSVNLARNLGSSTQKWNTIYSQYVTVSGDATVAGNLTVQGNIIQVGNIVTESLTIQLANAAGSANAADGAGITVGANDDIATILYSAADDVWTTNIGISAIGNVIAPYFVGDGSQLLNIPVGNNGAVQVAWLGKFSNQGGTPGDTYTTMQFDGDGLLDINGNTAYQPRVDYTPYITVNNPRVESTDFGIVAGPGITVVGYDDNYNTPRSAYLSVQDQATATQQWDFGILGNGSNNYSITDRTSSNVWTFGTDGSTTFPTGGLISNYPGIPGANNSWFVTPGNGTGGVSSQDGQQYIQINDNSFIDIGTGYGTANSFVWQFGLDGTFGAPGNINTTGNVSANFFLGDGSQLTGISTANTGNVTFNDITIQGTGDEFGGSGLYLAPGTASTANLQYLRVRGGDFPTHIHLDTGDNGYFDQYFGDDSKYVKLESGGNISIGTNNHNWVFGTDGGTIFPTLNTQRGDNPSGTIQGQTLLFGNATQEAIITTPDGTVGNEYSQRLVINPGAGNNFGEGGDIYLWAGRGGNGSGTGGDIKIRGGQGGANTQGGAGGDGGYIRMEAGDAATTGGNPGYIDITGGYSNTVGGYVNVTGGQGNTIGGDVKIYGGYGTATGGNVNIWGGASGNGQANEGHVNIETGGNTWTFSADGTTQFPANTINTAGQLSIKSFDSLLDIQSANTTVGSGGEILLNSGFTGPTSAGVTIAAYVDGTLPALKEWVFDAYGLLTLPADGSITGNTGISFDSSVGGNTSGLYVTGNITEGGNSYLYATNNVYVRADNNGTSKDWVFGADGVLTLPNSAKIKDTVGNAVAFGLNAGQSGQGNNSVAIGTQAGNSTQGTDSVAIGTTAGFANQGIYAVAVGYQAGNTTQGNSAVAVGDSAGLTSQGSAAVAIGSGAGLAIQGINAVAIGVVAGQNSQGAGAVAIGNAAGYTGQGISSVAIGNAAGYTAQGNNSIILNATGSALDQTTPNTFTVAPVRNDVTTANVAQVLFYNTTSKEVTYGNTISVAGNVTSGNVSTGIITLTNGAVLKDTATYAVAFGKDAGLTSQGQEAVAVGHYAGRTSQGNGGVAIGVVAGNSSQGENAVAVGSGAGRINQGSTAVAIGSNAGATNQGNNSIIINATGSVLNQTTANTFTVAPVRNEIQTLLKSCSTILPARKSHMVMS